MIGDDAVRDRAPGLRIIARKSGRKDVYWVADPAAVKAGYEPKTARLSGNPDDPADHQAIAARCRVLTAEVKEWQGGRSASVSSAPMGSIAWLCDLYQRDEDSPYMGVRPGTRITYDRTIKIVRETVGQRQIEAVTGKDVRRWFKSWGHFDDEADKLLMPRRAYGCIQMLRILANFGVETRHRPCQELAIVLKAQRYKQPGRRKQAMTAEHVQSFIRSAHDAGWPSLALAVALQFSCGLRQKDVIGEWLPAPSGGLRWSMGLTWGEHIRADWTLHKPTSKSNGNEVAEFDLKLLPLAMAELTAIPLERRIGPVVRCESTGKPWKQRLFAFRFREIARSCGIPDDVWNMDARAGAVTDAYDKGAQVPDAMDLATHKQMSTNRGYDRNRIAKTSRVSVLRFGKQNEA